MLATTEECRIRVACRLRRPCGVSGADAITASGKQVTVHASGTRFDFDDVLGGDSTDQDVLRIVDPLIRDAFRGYSAALACFGQSGSGKSHTVRNAVRETCRTLFRAIERDRMRAFEIRVQFVELYCGTARDALSPSGDATVRFLNSEGPGVLLGGCSSHAVSTREELEDLFNQGVAKCHVAVTEMNPESSRGHAAFVVHIKATSRGDDRTVTSGKITFVDMAGSEAAPEQPTASSPSTAGRGCPAGGARSDINRSALALRPATQPRARETRDINRSALALRPATQPRARETRDIDRSALALRPATQPLACETRDINRSALALRPATQPLACETRDINCSALALRQVVAARRAGAQHVPWRDSLLTRLLQDCFGGQSRLTLVVTVATAPQHMHESAKTLEFGRDAMGLTVCARPDVTVNHEARARALALQLSSKDERIRCLEAEVARLGSRLASAQRLEACAGEEGAASERCPPHDRPVATTAAEEEARAVHMRALRRFVRNARWLRAAEASPVAQLGERRPPR